MSLQTALSGLNGAQTGLNTVSNDLANASTTAFKSQTALFGDVYASGSTDQPGIGVTTSSMSSDFSQGATVSTGNPLDAAIEGNGFFIVDQNGQQQYTRDGSFELSPAGQLISSATGAQVMGFQSNGANAAAGTLGPITINTGAVAAKATANITVPFDLNSNDTPLTAAGFTPTNPATYNESTSVTTYDSLGNANKVALYFVNTSTAGNPPAWTVFAQPETPAGTAVAGSTPTQLTTLNFTTSGTLTTGSPAALAGVNWMNGAANSTVNFNFTGTTVGAQTFAVAGTPTNDGYAPGAYSGTTLSSTGELVSTYSNGQTVNSGTLAVANFINQEGLNPVSGNLYAATQSSGQAAVNVPGSGQAGSVVGGSLEQSNASTSSLLVSLIQFQQAYQANTSVIQTEQQDSTRLTQI
jgi:flagellar hook protein FlgE